MAVRVGLTVDLSGGLTDLFVSGLTRAAAASEGVEYDCLSVSPELGYRSCVFVLITPGSGTNFVPGVASPVMTQYEVWELADQIPWKDKDSLIDTFETEEAAKEKLQKRVEALDMMYSDYEIRKVETD